MHCPFSNYFLFFCHCFHSFYCINAILDIKKYYKFLYCKISVSYKLQ
nr:MAG TPA: hypothetical protein [Caudoviricetes sp.]